MTAKALIILMVIISSLYTVVLNIAKRRSAGNPTPENLADVYDAETYEKWKKYSAEHCKLELIFCIVGLVANLVMLITNVYASFAYLFPKTVFMQLLAVVLLETAVSTVISVVQGYVSTMIIEQKYGFNRSTVKTFVGDCIRSLILELLFALGIALLIAEFHMMMGAWMIVLFAAVVFGVTVLISFLYPVFSRIGNKFTPLEDGELKERLVALLDKYGYRVKAIEVMDASRRTTKLNAYFTGFGKMKTIVLFDNLIEAMSPDEICAIFAHELGHGLHKDVLKSQILNIGNLLLMAVVAWGAASIPQLYWQFGFMYVNYGFTYVLLGIGLSVLRPLVSLLTNAHSRIAEYRADRQAVTEGYGEAMITAFKKLAQNNLVNLAPSKLNVVLEYSHPPLDRRVAEVEKAMQEQAK